MKSYDLRACLPWVSFLIASLNPAEFASADIPGRGFDGMNDRYDVVGLLGNQLKVAMNVGNDGDWIRVVTLAVPESGKSGLAVGLLTAMAGWTAWQHRRLSHRG